MRRGCDEIEIINQNISLKFVKFQEYCKKKQLLAGFYRKMQNLGCGKTLIKNRVRTMSVKIYNKLIRDKIPQIIKQSGKQAITEEVSGQEYIKLLNAKLGEELQEYLESESVEELADLVEVVYAILEHKDVSLQEFEVIRKQKVEERGAFMKKLLLKEVIDG